ncbi:organic solvent tolerance family protein [Collimonas pratensis]|uniref:LPS-assembly protein LptD n=2 Tax=Collimonas pratensis TaxID=279113 RepID=A0A127Q9M7_9BURK|nr:organic solvent tolerance family protein [Collimonas pratensis]
MPALRRMTILVASVIAAVSMPMWAWAQSVEVTSPVAPDSQTNPQASPPKAKVPRVNDADAPTTVEAEQMTGRPDRLLNLDNDVDITRGGTNVKSKTGIYRIVENEAEAHGCVKMNRYGDRYTGDDLKLNMDSGQGYLTNPTYWFQANDGHGSAERINFLDEDRSEIVKGNYTTCPGTKPDWYIKSSTLDVDSGLGEGVAHNGILYFKSVPILGSPSLSFPLSNDRQSGVLPPIIGSTNNGGLEFNLPYYFNIAPNRDLTIYPNIISQRGLQMGADARYMGVGYSGQTKVEYLPDDRLFKSDRYAVQSVHTQTLYPGLTMGWNVNFASDNNYPDDFSRSITQSSLRTLNREFDLNYSGSFWSVAALASRYQILQDFNAAGLPTLSRPYDRMPQVTLTAGKQDIFGFDWNVNAQYTRFRNSQYDFPQGSSTSYTASTLLPLGGERVYINPQLSYPIIRPGFFITPKIQLDATAYSITPNKFGVANPIATAPGVVNPTALGNDFSRVLPTFSLDAGLIFERDAKFFGHPMTQTLEPRVFYVRTPYHDQSQFPLFDSAVSDFNFAQIFTENRYSGHDRISDANQLTTALISRFIEESGVERLRLGIGQRMYFTQPRVALNVGANNDDITTSRSDLLLMAGGQVTPTLGVDNTIQYSQSNNQWVRANSTVKWQPGPKKVINFSYQLDHTNIDPLDPDQRYLKQFDLSAQWPLSKRWYGVGRVSYSLTEKTVGQSLLGLEYKADCWVFRVVGQRTPTSSTRTTTGIFVQLELNGLSSIGSNPMQALRSSVPGYQNINQPDSFISR